MEDLDITIPKNSGIGDKGSAIMVKLLQSELDGMKNRLMMNNCAQCSSNLGQNQLEQDIPLCWQCWDASDFTCSVQGCPGEPADNEVDRCEEHLREEAKDLQEGINNLSDDIDELKQNKKELKQKVNHIYSIVEDEGESTEDTEDNHN